MSWSFSWGPSGSPSPRRCATGARTRIPPPRDEGLADPEPTTDVPEPNPTIEPAPPPHDPFTLHPADEDATPYEALTAEEQAGVDQIMEWAETSHGAAVHDGFAAAASRMSELRRVEMARRATGLEGIEHAGVVP